MNQCHLLSILKQNYCLLEFTQLSFLHTANTHPVWCDAVNPKCPALLQYSFFNFVFAQQWDLTWGSHHNTNVVMWEDRALTDHYRWLLSCAKAPDQHIHWFVLYQRGHPEVSHVSQGEPCVPGHQTWPPTFWAWMFPSDLLVINESTQAICHST